MLALSLSGGLACAGLMALVLIFYGPPWNPMWWWVMAAILILAFALPRLLAYPIEWIMDGYRGRGLNQAD